jgi:adenylate cyclase
MTKQSVNRRLAAILYGDVVGFSRLMGIDELGTHKSLRLAFDTITQNIERNSGRVVNYAGDAVLAEFPSVVAAVECAVSVQTELAAETADKPDDRKLKFRFGINLGEVIVDGSEIYGDGVNVAARLETLAVPGGICVSETIHHQVEGKLDLEFADLGTKKVKNIDRPIRTYAICLEGQSADELRTSALETEVHKSLSSNFQMPFFDALDSDKVLITGGCLCGAVRYLIDQAPIDTLYCHCSMCQRFSGAPIVAATAVTRPSLQFTQGKPKYYQSSPIAKRGFCTNCGSSLIYKPTVRRMGDWITVFTASMDNARDYAPSWHLGTESQMLPWLELKDELPRVRCKDSPGLVKAWATVGVDIT